MSHLDEMLQGLECENCGCDLRGLDRLRCPERGRPFRLGMTPKHKGSNWLSICGVGFLMYVLAIGRIPATIVIFGNVDGEVGGNSLPGFFILLMNYFVVGLPIFFIMVIGWIVWNSI